MSADTKLDEVAIQQMLWKSPKLLAACLLIVERFVESPIVWPDEIDFSFLTSDDDRNIIGSAWRQCSRTLGIIEKTGQWRRSKGDRTNGRVVFEYRLIDLPVARAFLKRHGKAVTSPQMEWAWA